MGGGLETQRGVRGNLITAKAWVKPAADQRRGWLRSKYGAAALGLQDGAQVRTQSQALNDAGANRRVLDGWPEGYTPGYDCGDRVELRDCRTPLARRLEPIAPVPADLEASAACQAMHSRFVIKPCQLYRGKTMARSNASTGACGARSTRLAFEGDNLRACIREQTSAKSKFALNQTANFSV